MGLFDSFKKKTVFINLQLNAKLQPLDRAGFEDAISVHLKKQRFGTITGGGTFMLPTKEIACCDVEFKIYEDKVEKFIEFLREIKMIPLGSKIIMDDKEIEIGTSHGLGLYLNGTDLPKEVYSNCDINELIEMLDEKLKGVAVRLSHWEGNSETALYYYGKDYDLMKDKIQSIIETYPLCEKSRIERIA